MKSIAVLGVLAFVLVGTASGATADERTGNAAPELTQAHRAAKAKAIQQHKAVRQRKIVPLQLPNINTLVKRLWKADRSTLAVQQHKSATVLAFFDGQGKWLLATRHDKCSEVPWQRSCRAARAAVRLHTALGRVATRRLQYELPATNDWLTSVRITQRVFPGTEQWLLSCSSGEGGHGGFVYNHQGSGAAGWMQFMPGTFYGHAPAALAHVKSMGFFLPDGLLDIHSTLGQALTAAYMRTHGMSSHWDPGVDPLCR